MLNLLRVHVVGDIVIIRRSTVINITVIYAKLSMYYITIFHIARGGDKVNLAIVLTQTAANAYDKFMYMYINLTFVTFPLGLWLAHC